MAEKITDDILEEATESSSQSEKKGLTSSLLIKIALGMTVLLLVLIVLFFFLTRPGEPEQGQPAYDNATEQSEQPDLISAADNTAAALELPAMGESAVDTVETDTLNSSDRTQAGLNASKVLSQLVILQQEINTLRQQTASLNQRIEQLVQENVSLENKINLLSEVTSADGLHNRQAANLNGSPLFYRHDKYAHTHQLELEPKWGEFNHQLDAAKKP